MFTACVHFTLGGTLPADRGQHHNRDPVSLSHGQSVLLPVIPKDAVTPHPLSCEVTGSSFVTVLSLAQ
jgi:hypothetical protein